MEIWFTHFEKWKVKWKSGSLISRMKSEMKMPWYRDREWKVKWECLKIEIESEKWIENASRSRSRSEISREFSRNFEIFLRIKKSRKFSNFVTNSFHFANFYFGIQQNAFGDGPWLRHVTCKAVWMDWVGNLWMHLCSDHCLVMLIKRKSESESFSVTFNLSLNLEVVKFICFHSLVTMTEWEPTNRSLLWGTYFTKMENEGKCVACYKVLQCKGGNTVEPQIRSSASHCPSLTRNAYFTLFSREKRVKFEMLSLFPRNEKWNQNALKSRSRVKSEMKMPRDRDREVKLEKNSREFSRNETLAGYWGGGGAKAVWNFWSQRCIKVSKRWGKRNFLKGSQFDHFPLTFMSLIFQICFLWPRCFKILPLDGSNLRESRFSRILENFFPISLLDLDLEAFSFHFSLSISISRHFHFTFHSRNEWKEKQIHFSFLEKSESISDFTLFLEKKEWIMHVLSWKIQKIDHV